MGVVSQGRDVWCVDELKPGRYASGKTLVGQRCYHRLITPPGTLKGGEDEADFGMDLAAFIGSNAPRDVATMLPVRVKNELMKDPCVNGVEVEASKVEAAGVITWTLICRIDTTDGDVELIASSDGVTTQLLGIS